MDPIINPFAPGAGTPPPELAGRDALREQVRIAIERARRGLPAKSVLMVGLRGAGKTVLLERMRSDAEAAGAVTARVEAPESRSLPSVLAPQLRQALLRMSRLAQAKNVAHRALGALAGFLKQLKPKYNDIEVTIDIEPLLGVADNGDLEHDLPALMEAIGQAAKAGETVLAMFIDELQYVAEDQLGSLITALHRCAQLQLPVVLVGAGLPQLRGRMGNAKSYAERMFDFPEIGPLQPEDARQAIVKPVVDNGGGIQDEAVDEILTVTQRYPYFLQEWGKHAWDVAPVSPITRADVQRSQQLTIKALDTSFFQVRNDRVTPAERKYLRAMAELGPGPHRSGAVADILGRDVSALAPTRSALIKKGMVWSPSHGDTAFTVPLFDEYLRRVMPGSDWR